MSAFIYKSISVLFFVLMSVCIKATGDNLPLFEVVFFRSFFALIPLFLVIFYFNLKITSINNYKLHFFMINIRKKTMAKIENPVLILAAKST